MHAPPRYARSRAVYDRACRSIPGAHHLSGRPLLDLDRSPLYFDWAKGCRIRDVDGNEYIDYVMAYGAYALGYAHEGVDGAAFAQAARGSLVSLNHPLHVRFIEALLERFPFAEMGVFLKTGSEATTAALRIARRATGRRAVVRCGYHGWHDWCLPDDAAVPAGLAEQVLELRPVGAPALEQLFSEHPGAIAAVIVAPEMVRPFEPSVLAALAETSRRRGAVFVLDEVKTAFRTAPGSLHQRVGVTPDLLTVSKALGNGWPVAAVLGPRSVMESASGMHLSATYHGDTASMAAALATLAILDRDDVPAHLWQTGDRLIDGLRERARAHGVPVVAYGEPLPPMPFMQFRHEDEALNASISATFYEEVLARGVLLHPRHLWFVSQAHREPEVARTLDACDDAFAAVRARYGGELQR